MQSLQSGKDEAVSGQTEDSMRIWNQLSKTDPKHVKSFTRAGGFKGHAVRPIYAIQKMTEIYGPAGEGWGTGEPVFQVVPGVNQEIMVYCTVGLWVRDSNNPHWVWGVGGDKAVGYVKANEQYKRPERWENDDEAFKKAFTDALTNAMKHLGMSADVHMGLFDDSKYVRQREAEEAGADRQTGELPPPPKAAIPDTVQTDTGVGSAPITVGRADARPHYDAIAKALSAAETLKQLQGAWERNAPIVATLPADWQLNLVEHKDSLKDSFLAKIAATP